MLLNLTNNKMLYKQLIAHKGHKLEITEVENGAILECMTCGIVLMDITKPVPRPLFSCLPTNWETPIYFYANSRLEAEAYVLDVLKLGLSSVVLTTANLSDIEDVELSS